MSNDPSKKHSPAPPFESGEAETAESRPTKLPKIIRFDELAVCGDEIWIDNQGELYRLRRTKQGKLILTK